MLKIHKGKTIINFSFGVHKSSRSLLYLNEYSLNESEADEDNEAGHEVDDEADGALRVQADQHHAFPAEPV